MRRCRVLLFALAIAPVWGCGGTPVQSTPACNYSLSPASQSATAAGGQATVNASRTSGTCGWTAQADATWLTLSNSSGSDTAAIGYSATENPATDSRTGHIAVSWSGGASQVTVTQAGRSEAACSYSVDPGAVTAPGEGSSGQLAVTVTGNNCTWSAQPNQFWIHMTSATSGAASGTIAYTVDPNTTGQQRFGRFVVTHTGGTTDIGFTQNPPCSAALNPATQSVGNTGGAFSTAFTTASGCAWTAASDSSWLTMSSPASGTGDATVSYSAAGNSGPARSGYITVTAGGASARLTVNQNGTCDLPGTPGFLGWTTAGMATGSVQLSWGPATGTVTSYVIEVGTTVGGTDVAVIDTGSNTSSYTLTGLTTSVNFYHVRVRARNSCGASGPSNEANPSIA
jgi:Putative binding domain, N-terminal/Fibronectin type III domain/Viral BACON domain